MYVQFIAQPIVRVGDQLMQGAARAFSSAMDAEAAGERLAETTAGVIVYEIWGDPENDVWEEPMIIAVHGQAATVLQADLSAH